MDSNILTIDLRQESDVVLARQRARQIAAALKFESQEQTRIATALSEIARNAFQYAGGGQVEFHVDGVQEPALVITVRDKGAGIAHLREVLDGKCVSPTGPGLGIVGAKRLMDQFTVETSRDGTTVIFGKRLPRKFVAPD